MGDLIVNISVYVPKTLSREEKEMLEKRKNSDNFKGDIQTKRSIFDKFRNYFSYRTTPFSAPDELQTNRKVSV